LSLKVPAMISVDQALSIVLENVQPLEPETVPLEASLGRILREDVQADMDLPPFDRARMDGYALRHEDGATAPVTLRLIGEVAAGSTFDGVVNRGEAVKIFTGAPVPPGADAVQKVEVTERDGADGLAVLIKESVSLGQFITPRASEVTAGERVAAAGTEVGPAETAVLASFGYDQVRVGSRPRVAVLSTGSELVPVSATPSNSQIRNSNSYTIAAYSGRSGGRAEILGTVPDTMEASRDALLAAARDHDVVVTSGGVSMGDYDLVKAALQEIGARIYFDKVAIRPGKPIVFARLGDTYFFGLPGNPVSTSVTFNVFVRPAIRKMLGDSSPLLPAVQARLDRPIKDASSRRSYLPAALSIASGAAVVTPLKWGGSSDLVGFMNSNALIVVAEDVHEIAAGEFVDALLIGSL
jgi:molybdopterin molybdotransferase